MIEEKKKHMKACISARWHCLRRAVLWMLCLCLCVPQSVWAEEFTCSVETMYAKQESSGSNLKTVTLCKNNRRCYQKISVQSGKNVKLPSMANTVKETFLGWSDKPGQSTRPKYEAGETIKVTGNRKLYAVMFPRSQEQDLTSGKIAVPDTKKYRKVIFVGDSRTCGMQYVLQQMGCLSSDISVVARGGKGLKWLKQEGIYQLFELVRASDEETRPAAVIFNLGVNDLSNVKSYIQYMNKLAKKLKKRGCVLYYMSVNPMNNAMRQSNAKNERKIRSFNTQLQKGLSSDFTYIDTYHWLLKTGYSTGNKKNVVNDYDDGLHYTAKTYKRIYNFCIKKINR